MRVLPALLLSLGGCATFASLTSQTIIEPQKSFLLGGGQRGAFSVTGKNAGSVPVTLFVDLRGKRDSITTLAPGAPFEASFPAEAMAVIRNTSTSRNAMVNLKVRGDAASLGMRYEAARD